MEPSLSASVDSAPPDASIPAGDWILDHITAYPGTPVAAAIIGPGGTGKSLLLKRVAQQYANSGIDVTVVTPASSIDSEYLDAQSLDPALPLLIDDAHRLPETALTRLLATAQAPHARIVVAYRPWPRPIGLRGLTAALSRLHPPAVLTHLNRDAIGDRISTRLRVDIPEPLVDLVQEQSGGLPWLTDLVTQALVDSGRFDPTRPQKFRRPQRVNVSTALAERLRHRIEELDPEVRRLLEALAVGAELDADVLASLLDCETSDLDDTVEAALATGLLTGSGQIIGFIAGLILRLAPVLRGRKLQRRYAEIQLERGGNMLAVGQQLLDAGASGATVAAALTTAGEQALRERPELADKLFAAAVVAGAPQRQLSARRAQAAVLAGDHATALRLAEEAIAESTGPDRERAVMVAATLLAQRGVLSRSVQLYNSVAESAVLAAPLLIGAGDLAQTQALLEVPAPAAGISCLSEVGQRIARALLASIETGHTEALAQLTSAITLAEPIGETLLLPDTPAALSAIVAVQCGELEVAESALRRAVASRLGGRPAHTRHLLLHGWTAMLTGNLAAAHRALHNVSTGMSQPLQPRDELLAAALQAGLARREADFDTISAGSLGTDFMGTDAMSTAWLRGRQALIGYPLDLYSLQQVGELTIAAAVAQDADGVSPYLRQADVLLTKLGNPALWAVPLHWCRLHAALAMGDPALARHHAKLLAASRAASRYAAALAAAGDAWISTIDGIVDPTAVLQAARLLQTAGFSAEGARLAGRAAATVTDPKDAAALLGCARALTGSNSTTYNSVTSNSAANNAVRSPTDAPFESPEPFNPPRPFVKPAKQAPHVVEGTVISRPSDSDGNSDVPRRDCILSARELEVGRLILAGHTHKQIGGKLFISAKTVEHHVARIRQRLLVSSRTELFGRLLTIIEDTTPTN